VLKPIQWIPADTTFPFVKWAPVSYAVSALAIVASILLFLFNGLNLGVDFKGGTLIEIQTPEPADLADLRGRLGGLGLGDVQIQEFGAANEVLIRIGQQPGGDEAQRMALDQIRQALGDGVTYRRVEVVGPTVSRELAINGTIAVVAAVIGILVYVWFRFEWQFAVASVLALVHDAVVTIGMFSLLWLDFNLTTIAALLTIVGYSINDTVVIMDRIRELLRRYKQMPLAELIDKAVNETLARTFMTAITTLIALFALYFLGGEVISDFVFAMIWGIVVGTYSSVFVAAPMLITLGGVKRDWSGEGGARRKERPASP